MTRADDHRRAPLLAWILVILSLLMFSPAFADDAESALQFIPQETMLIVSMDMELAWNSPHINALLTTLKENPNLKMPLRLLEKEIGFDLSRDLSSLTLAIPSDVEESQNFLMIAKGHFNESRFSTFAKAQSNTFSVSDYEGIHFYQLDRRIAVSFINNHLVLGTPSSLKTAILTSKGKHQKVQSHPQMWGLIERIRAGHGLWLALILPNSTRDEIGEGLPAAQKIISMRMGLSFEEETTIETALRVIMSTTEDKGAESLLVALKPLLQNLEGHPMIVGIGAAESLSSARLRRVGKEVVFRLGLGASEMEKANHLLNSLR